MLDTVTRKEAVRALQVHMADSLTAYNLANSTSLVCFYDNVIEGVADLNSYLKFNINFSGSAEKLTPTVFRQVGVAVIRVCIPIGKGTNESLDITDFFESVDGFLLKKWPNNVMEINDIGVTEIGPDGANYITDLIITFQFNKGTKHGK